MKLRDANTWPGARGWSVFACKMRLDVIHSAVCEIELSNLVLCFSVESSWVWSCDQKMLSCSPALGGRWGYPSLQFLSCPDSSFVSLFFIYQCSHMMLGVSTQ
jgi:hypothetical protein